MSFSGLARQIKANKVIFVILFLLFTQSQIFAEVYDLSLKQRRAYDQIHVEIWARSLTTDAPRFGSASLVVQYNTDYLSPSAQQGLNVTDSIMFNINQLNPVETIYSDFHSDNGYGALGSQYYSAGFYALEVNLQNLGVQGVTPSSDGRGSFVGILSFDIIGNPGEDALTGIEWSKSDQNSPGDIRIFDADSNDIESDIYLRDPGDFTAVGVTVISPDFKGQVIDRDQDYKSLTGAYEGGGYPIYFERSINTSEYESPVDEDLAYLVQYSLDNGNSWSNIGRLAETDKTAGSVASNPNYVSGEIYTAGSGSAYLLTDQDGDKLSATNYRSPVRVLWEKNPNFTERSEQARIKITMLEGTIDDEILSRTRSDIYDINADMTVLGRLFFLQLNGEDQYLKTDGNFSNPTQLTVEAWINLNEYQAYGSEPGIVVSSAGPDGTVIQGSREGAWMLYLEDGRKPAFRVREIESRGEDGYLAKVVAYYMDSLEVASDEEPLDEAHSKNWVHLAGTVRNNEVCLYVNGEMVDKVVNDSATDIRMMTTQHPVWIGVNPNNGIEGDDYLHAGLKSVRVWRIALSQDEIRERTAGVTDPTDVTLYGDLRRGFEQYYSFEGESEDLASEIIYQNGTDELDYYNKGNVQNTAIKYRPDRPHIKMTAPVEGAGVSNIEGEEFDIRWVSYGMGDIHNAGTADIEIEYSIDDGSTWFPVKDQNNTAYIDNDAPDVETSTTIWEPFHNDDTSANLQTINPYAHETILRIRGTEENTQSELMDVSGAFTVAPYFAVSKDEGSIIVLGGKDGMNITGNVAFIEAWIRPYSFPSQEGEVFPIISKIDSTSNMIHYALNLMYDGRLQFLVTDTSGTVRSAYSDTSNLLVRPNSVALDTPWTHVAVYLYLNDGDGPSEVKFYIDGIVHDADDITSQLGDGLVLNDLNKYPTYIGYSPSYSFVETSTDTIPAKQTEIVKLTGNINSGTPEGVVRSTSIDIYDEQNSTHTLDIVFTKTAEQNIYDYAITIDGSTIPNQTEDVWLMGNLSTQASEGDQTTTDVILTDFQGVEHTMTFTFTKTANDLEFYMEATINGQAVSQSSVFFDEDGIVDFPANIVISASDLNLVAGSFDEAEPKNVTIHFSDSTYGILTHTPMLSDLSTYIIEVEDVITFHPNGTMISPLSLTFEGRNLNTAVGSVAFDPDTDLTIVFAEEGKLTEGMTQFAGANTMSASYQDGTEEYVVTHDITVTHSESEGFVGELRELRFWNGAPNNESANGNEPTKMSLYIQGAQAVRIEDIIAGNYKNLNRAFSFDGGSFIINGYNRAAALSPWNNVIARHYGTPIRYNAVEPYIKLVEPSYKQRVANTDDDVRIRWVGFNYDGLGFSPGVYIDQIPPSLEFSIRGGGGQVIQPYQYVGSFYWDGNVKNSLSFMEQDTFMFSGTNDDLYFAALLDASMADPDLDNQEPMTDQGPISASVTNARLRLTSEYTINDETNTIRTEGPLFTITPASNFTVRVLLEGYHTGSSSGNDIVNLAPEYALGGLRIKLYEDNSGGIGELVGTAESEDSYDERDPYNRNAGNDRFANVNFVFTDLADGNYWVVVEHMNHLPVMSRFAAPFQYVGDDIETWNIESGWDFESWNGIDNNVQPGIASLPWAGRYYTAYGDAMSTTTDVGYSTTGLVYNDGQSGGSSFAMAAMVGGDVDKDGQINAGDRVRVRLDDGTGLISSDVTGDGYINAIDRTICDRNFGKVSSLYEIFPLNDEVQGIAKSKDPFNYVSELDPEKSAEFNAAAANKPQVSIKTKGNRTLATYNYKVWAKPRLVGNNILLDFFIQNYGNNFALANCTFAVTYNSSRLNFLSLAGTDTVIFNNNPEIGYDDIRTAPKDGASDPLPDVRTIEIDYDAFEMLPGAAVPTTETYFGSLKFGIKNYDGPIIFAWHPSTAVITVEHEIITDDGDFEDIDPILPYEAVIIKPNGGEELSANRLTTIEWETDGTSLVYLEYSRDAGTGTWYRINTDPVNADDEVYNWVTPDISTRYALVRIVDEETETVLDVSDSVFSIIPGFAQIIRPSSGDPIYQGGSVDSIRWVSKGYDKIRFEFSSDGGENWKSVTPELDPKLGAYKWKIPEVTTKNALVKMIDVETEETIATSTPFKILNGNFKFRDPREGDEIEAQSTIRIMWVYEDIDKVDIDYSTNGSTWERLQSQVDVRHNYIYWTVNLPETDNAYLRALWQGDPDMEFDRVGPFSIIDNTKVNDRVPPGYEINNIYPNPANDEVNIGFTLPEDEFIRISLINVEGKEIKTINSGYYTKGSNNIIVNVKELSSGKYFVNFKSSNINILREINIVD